MTQWRQSPPRTSPPRPMETFVKSQARTRGARRRRWAKGNLVGEGTYGQVYRALNPHWGDVCRETGSHPGRCRARPRGRATKTDVLEDDNPVDELQREVALMKLQHKHIVRCARARDPTKRARARSGVRS